MSLEVISLVAVGIGASIAASGIFDYFRQKNDMPETLEDRINKLTTALKESSQLVTEVESEIQTRQHLVKELQSDAKRYEQLISMNQEQVDAVAQVLQGELRREGKVSFWKGVAVNFTFFVMGAGASWYISVNF